MKSLELKIPPVIIFFIAIVGVYYSSVSENVSNWLGAYSSIAGISVFSFGILVGVIGVITFRRSRTTLNPLNIEKASTLVTYGIYKYTRNPMYLGMALGIVGLGLYKQSAILHILFCLFFYIAYMTRFQVVPEERMLGNIFGNAFEEYKTTTRRWL